MLPRINTSISTLAFASYLRRSFSTICRAAARQRTCGKAPLFDHLSQTEWLASPGPTSDVTKLRQR